MSDHQINRESPDWRAVEAWANDRLADHRRALEVQGMSHEDTECVRACIAELLTLLKLPKASNIGIASPPEARKDSRGWGLGQG